MTNQLLAELEMANRKIEVIKKFCEDKIKRIAVYEKSAFLTKNSYKASKSTCEGLTFKECYKEINEIMKLEGE